MDARMVRVGVKHLRVVYDAAAAGGRRRAEAKRARYGVVGRATVTTEFLFSPPFGASIGKPHLQRNVSRVSHVTDKPRIYRITNLPRDLRIGNFRSNRISNRIRG